MIFGGVFERFPDRKFVMTEERFVLDVGGARTARSLLRQCHPGIPRLTSRGSGSMRCGSSLCDQATIFDAIATSAHRHLHLLKWEPETCGVWTESCGERTTPIRKACIHTPARPYA